MKKITSILLISLMTITMCTSPVAASQSSSENMEHSSIVQKTPCTGSHSVKSWKVENSYYEDPPTWEDCRILVREYRGLCTKCNYYVGKTERKQLQHNFAGGSMCINGCGVGLAR